MNSCKILLITGEELTVNMSAEKMVGRLTDKDRKRRLRKKMVLIDSKEEGVVYLNPAHIVKVSESVKKEKNVSAANQETANGKHEEENLDAIKSMETEVDTLE